MNKYPEKNYEEFLVRKYHDYYQDDNYTLFDAQKFYYPYFKVTCTCIFREKSKISIVEEVFLKAIQCGVDNYPSLQEFMALDREVFEALAGKVHSENLFIEKPNLLLTKEGIQVLEEGEKTSTFEDDKYVVLDGITGQPCQIDLSDERRRDKSNANNIKVQIPYPKNETLDRVINNKAIHTILFEKIQKDDNKNIKVYEIKEIPNNSYKFHKGIYALFFNKPNSSLKVLIIKDGKPDDEMTNLFKGIQDRGVNSFIFSKENETKNKDEKELITVYDYADTQNLSNGTQLGTYTHPKFFDYLFKYSKKEIIVISPWVKWEIIKDKEDDIHDALKRGVKIIFFYGMGKPDDIDKRSRDLFNTFKTQYPELFSFTTNGVNDHSKIIICDRDWMITTSFNWTSFKGDINRQERKERGSFINQAKHINSVLDDYNIRDISLLSSK